MNTSRNHLSYCGILKIKQLEHSYAHERIRKGNHLALLSVFKHVEDLGFTLGPKPRLLLLARTRYHFPQTILGDDVA